MTSLNKQWRPSGGVWAGRKPGRLFHRQVILVAEWMARETVGVEAGGILWKYVVGP